MPQLYEFRDRSGYVIQQEVLALGHTAVVPPWFDSNIHIHTTAYEYYILWQGELHFLVDGQALKLHAPEILVVKPQVPHAIVGGVGPVEHFGLRVPGIHDKQVVADLPSVLSPFECEEERLLQADWGYRIPLADPAHQNWWVLGVHEAIFHSPLLAMAYLNFATAEESFVHADRNQLHYHRASWEYYLALRGSITLQVEDNQMVLNAGEILSVPPGVKHCVIGRTVPYQGLTLRTPVQGDKVLVVPMSN
ncbi:MAG: cupin domain-containing protein [Chloroflexi bacterium]|nr:cupin domain-containing protein [Chloroflexota bacterium]